MAGSGAAVGLLLGGILTEYLSWRWCLFVNIGFAAIAVTGALVLLQNHRTPRRSRTSTCPARCSAPAASSASSTASRNAADAELDRTA